MRAKQIRSLKNFLDDPKTDIALNLSETICEKLNAHHEMRVQAKENSVRFLSDFYQILKEHQQLKEMSSNKRAHDLSPNFHGQIDHLIDQFIEKKAGFISGLISIIPFLIGDPMMTGALQLNDVTQLLNGRLTFGDYFSTILCAILFYGIPYGIHLGIKSKLIHKMRKNHLETPQDIKEKIQSLTTKNNLIICFIIVLIAVL